MLLTERRSLKDIGFMGSLSKNCVQSELTSLLPDCRRPKLSMFEKVEGSKISEGLIPTYQLPNGKPYTLNPKSTSCQTVRELPM